MQKHFVKRDEHCVDLMRFLEEEPIISKKLSVKVIVDKCDVIVNA